MEKSRELLALEYAFDVLKQSELYAFIQKIVLFGSYARGEQTEESDIDLLVILPDFVLKEYRNNIRQLRFLVTKEQMDATLADVKFVSENEWNNSNSAFYQAVRQEGVVIWEKY